MFWWQIYSNKIYKEFWYGFCCPPSNWNKLFQIQINFFLIEYKFSLIMDKDMYWKKKKKQKTNATTARIVTYKPIALTGWLMCYGLFILWDWYRWIFKIQSGWARKVNGSGCECLYMDQTALLLVFQWVGSRPTILI